MNIVGTLAGQMPLDDILKFWISTLKPGLFQINLSICKNSLIFYMIGRKNEGHLSTRSNKLGGVTYC